MLEVTQEEYWLLYEAVQSRMKEVRGDSDKYIALDQIKEEFKNNSHLAV